MEIGVLDIQGDVSEHLTILDKMEVKGRRVRRTSDMYGLDGLIIPGGESTVIGSIMNQRGFPSYIVENKVPIMGTCAGIILMSKNIGRSEGNLPLLNIRVRRNGYGSQRESFETDLNIKGIGKFRGVFIRAPVIEEVFEGEILSTYEGFPVAVREELNVGLTFHPEIYGDWRIHKLFVDRL